MVKSQQAKMRTFYAVRRELPDFHLSLCTVQDEHYIYSFYTLYVHYTVAKFKPTHLHRLLQPLAEFYDTLDKYMHVGYVLAIGKEHKLSD